MSDKIGVNRTLKFASLEFRDKCDQLVVEESGKSSMVLKSGVRTKTILSHLDLKTSLSNIIDAHKL